MGKSLDIAKNVFNMAKGKALEKDKDGDKQKFNLNNFKGELTAANGLYRPNRYRFVLETIHKCLAPVTYPKPDNQKLEFYCDNVNIPGASIIPVDYKRLGVGPFDRRASAIIPAEISASFMLDNTGKNLDFFQQWVSRIVYMGNDKALHMAEETPGGPTRHFGEIDYHSNYTCQVKIETYDVRDVHINTTRAYEVWPSQLGDVTLGWAQNDEVGRVTINFQLQRWVTTNETDKDFNATEVVESGREYSGMERLLRIGAAARSLKSAWKKPRNVGDVINLVSGSQTLLSSFGSKYTPDTGG